MAELSSTKIYGDLEVTGIIKNTTTVISNDTTLFSNKGVFMVDTSVSGITLTLPASPMLGDRIIIYDMTGFFSVNNLIILPSDRNIMGFDESATIDVGGSEVVLIYANTTLGWRVFISQPLSSI